MRRMMVTGNLTADAQIKEINGTSAMVFTIAVNEKYTDKNGLKVDKPFFYDCSVWRDDVNKLVNYFKRGQKMLIEGTPDLNLYTDKEGKTKGGIRIRVNLFEFLSSTKKEGANSNHHEGNDDMPF